MLLLVVWEPHFENHSSRETLGVDTLVYVLKHLVQIHLSS